MKTCAVCNIEKSTDEFRKRLAAKDGLRHECKSCSNSRDLSYRQDNADKIKSAQDQYYQSNKYKWTEYNLNRRAGEKKATPIWLTGEQRAKIKRLYKLSKFMSEATGVPYHVDHIVPINSDVVCGLNVPWNLQVLRADLNMSKSNKFEGQ